VRLARRCKEIFLLIWGSTASGVRPSVECFRRTDAESLPAPKIFLQKRLSHKGYRLYGQNHFWTGFWERGVSNFQNPKVPLPGGSICRTHIQARLRCVKPCQFRPARCRRRAPIQANLARSRGTCRVKARCSGRCAGCGQRRGRFFEVKNRPRANPVRGVGGRPGSRNLVAMARFVARCWLRRPCVYLALPNVDSVKIRVPAKVMPVK
jgi:hypothetical protein